MDDLETRAEWDTAYVNDLPDSAFAVILPGGEKDADGKTTPRDLRKLPHHNAEGGLDLPHVRNGLSREPQADMPGPMHDRARSHLEAHLASETRTDVVTLVVDPEHIEVRDYTKRELDVRLVPWNVPIETIQGREYFEPGAFDGAVPDRVLLMGSNHEAHLGIGQDGRPVLSRRPTGKATALWSKPDGGYATFRVARTQSGDEILALAADRIVSGVSVEFREVPGGTETKVVDGRRTRVHHRVDLQGASTTHRPAYEQAVVLQVRTEGEPEMPDPQPAEVTTQAAPPPVVDMSPVADAIAGQSDNFTRSLDALAERIFEDRRRDIAIPAAVAEVEARSKRGDWAHAVIRMLSGERINDMQMRELADLVTADNVGVVPDAFVNELIGVIDPTRPFLGSTRRLDLPPAGMSLVVPTIVTRPTAGVQAIYGDESYPEKSDITSTATSITNTTFDAVTIAGGGDISLQLLKRSSPSYLSLFLELLAEAYAENAESEALATLIATIGQVGGVNNGGSLDPENLVLGPAWTSGAAVKKPINTMWLSSAAVAGFIDAKASSTNAPLYSQIQSGFTAGAGPAGTISGLRPVYVPALDATAVDVIVGPSSGFGWTEDGTYTLQVDVPAKAGRDVALVGILWFAPMYPTAFTAYEIAGS